MGIFFTEKHLQQVRNLYDPEFVFYMFLLLYFQLVLFVFFSWECVQRKRFQFPNNQREPRLGNWYWIIGIVSLLRLWTREPLGSCPNGVKPPDFSVQRAKQQRSGQRERFPDMSRAVPEPQELLSVLLQPWCEPLLPLLWPVFWERQY